MHDLIIDCDKRGLLSLDCHSHLIRFGSSIARIYMCAWVKHGENDWSLSLSLLQRFYTRLDTLR